MDRLNYGGRKHTATRSTRTVVVTVHNRGRRGKCFTFVQAEEMCACGALPNVVPLPLQISRRPLAKVARLLLAAGFDPDTSIALKRDGQTALTSTIGAAAKSSVTASKTGKPVFARNSQRRPRTRAIARPPLLPTGRREIEPASLPLHSASKRA